MEVMKKAPMSWSLKQSGMESRSGKRSSFGAGCRINQDLQPIVARSGTKKRHETLLVLHKGVVTLWRYPVDGLRLA